MSKYGNTKIRVDGRLFEPSKMRYLGIERDK